MKCYFGTFIKYVPKFMTTIAQGGKQHKYRYIIN